MNVDGLDLIVAADGPLEAELATPQGIAAEQDRGIGCAKRSSCTAIHSFFLSGASHG